MDPLLERGIALFNRGEYFDCHEVLEEVWTSERGRRRLFLQSLIHVAVGFYHDQRYSRRIGQVQRVVQFTVGQQSGIGGNRGTTKLEH